LDHVGCIFVRYDGRIKNDICNFPDLLFFNRELNAMVVVELKMGEFKTSYLRQFFDERSDHKSSGWGI